MPCGGSSLNATVLVPHGAINACKNLVRAAKSAEFINPFGIENSSTGCPFRQFILSKIDDAHAWDLWLSCTALNVSQAYLLAARRAFSNNAPVAFCLGCLLFGPMLHPASLPPICPVLRATKRDPSEQGTLDRNVRRRPGQEVFSSHRSTRSCTLKSRVCAKQRITAKVVRVFLCD